MRSGDETPGARAPLVRAKLAGAAGRRRAAPLVPGEGPLRDLSAAERALLATQGETPVYRAILSTTRVDVGSWLRDGRIWVCARRVDLLLFAAGPRPFVERLAFNALQSSAYNHVTGELILAPAEGARVRQVRALPAEALAVLEWMRHSAPRAAARSA